MWQRAYYFHELSPLFFLKEIVFSAIMPRAVASLLIYPVIFNWRASSDPDISWDMTSKLSLVENICRIEIFDD